MVSSMVIKSMSVLSKICLKQLMVAYVLSPAPFLTSQVLIFTHLTVATFIFHKKRIIKRFLNVHLKRGTASSF